MPKRLLLRTTALMSTTRAQLDSGHLPHGVIALAAVSGAGVVAAFAAWASALWIESRSEQLVTSRLLDAGITWAAAEADGLQLHLIGTAPNEAARFRAVNLAGTVIDASRVRDMLDVTPVKAIEAPKFSVEMLRNDDGIQLIGLLPTSDSAEALLTEARALRSDGAISDMLETAAYPAPEGWDAAFAFGMEAVKRLPRSKVSVAAGRVSVTAIATSAEEQRRLTNELNNARPEGLQVSIDISAPRPVLTPFTLRFVLDEQGARFDACAADTDRARARIIAAGMAAGVPGRPSCIVGLGVPTPSWADAVATAITAVTSLGAATITFSDADVSLVAADSVSQSDFDRIVGELDSALPEVFSLTATLERATDAALGPAEFTATLSADGRVELRGRVTDELLRNATTSYAKARFGVGKVYSATRLDNDLPDGWPVRVLAGLEALGELAEGRLLVRADTVEVEGVTGSQIARSRISQVLSDKLGQGQTFKVSVRYDEELDPLAALPTPQECAADVTAVLAARKITFPPGSAEIDGQTVGIMDALAEVLEDCPTVQMEIAGYTDSQGSDSGNLALSQARADAVLLALQGRGVTIDALKATGYGEANPIADNATEAGREANRRIEFVLLDQPGAPSASTAGNPASAQVSAIPGVNDEDSPSVAPTEKTRRPLARPARDG
ncbi:OmpA family protein [Pseudotabrizicola sediminis]|nr:OmpA family protein [Pseudotabrizicola sediminis]